MRNIYDQENLEWLNDVNLVSNVDSYSKARASCNYIPRAEVESQYTNLTIGTENGSGVANC